MVNKKLCCHPVVCRLNLNWYNLGNFFTDKSKTKLLIHTRTSSEQSQGAHYHNDIKGAQIKVAFLFSKLEKSRHSAYFPFQELLIKVQSGWMCLCGDGTFLRTGSDPVQLYRSCLWFWWRNVDEWRELLTGWRTTPRKLFYFVYLWRTLPPLTVLWGLIVLWEQLVYSLWTHVVLVPHWNYKYWNLSLNLYEITRCWFTSDQ